MPKALHLALLLALGLMPLAGCVVHVPATTAATAAAYSYSWIEQVKVQVEAPAAGPRVASAPQSWHLIRLQVGRLDGSMPVLAKTINPYENDQARKGMTNLTPGEGYFIQASLIHRDPDGTEWEVARGQLGGDGESVRLNAGPNAVPILMKPMVAGGAVATSPSRLPTSPNRRSGSSRSSSTIIVLDPGSSDDETEWEPSDDTYDEAPGAETIYDWMDQDDEEEAPAEERDEEEDEDTGDWFGVTSALKVQRPL